MPLSGYFAANLSGVGLPKQGSHDLAGFISVLNLSDEADFRGLEYGVAVGADLLCPRLVEGRPHVATIDGGALIDSSRT
jgi:hypothetical protein